MMILTTQDLRAEGLDPYGVRRAVSSAKLTRISRDAYLREPVPTRADEQHCLKVLVAMQRTSTDAVASHVSAAVIHGLPVPWGELNRVRVTRRTRKSGSSSESLLVTTASLSPVDVTTAEGIAVTTIARTLVDLARTVPLSWAVAAMDHALHHELTTREDVLAAADRLPRARGIRGVQRMVQLTDQRAESPGESLSRVVMHGAGLPAPDLQVRFMDGQGVIGRVDFYWRELGVIGEFDGMAKYLANTAKGVSLEDAVWAEKRREDRLRALSHFVVRWVWDEVFRNPNAVTARIRETLLRAHEARRKAGAD